MNKASKYLLDTHIFIWWLEDNRLLSSNIKQVINNPQNLILLSVASIWEMIIKKAAGKLRHPPNLREAIENSGFSVLQVELNHVLELNNLPLLHKDPFDRILIAQAMAERLTLITADSKIAKYSVQTLEA